MDMILYQFVNLILTFNKTFKKAVHFFIHQILYALSDISLRFLFYRLLNILHYRDEYSAYYFFQYKIQYGS